jgi:phosphoribosylanthranilate isomerase
MKKTKDHHDILAPSCAASGKTKIKTKICGMKYPENISDIGSLLPDYMGFIFWEKSARYFDDDKIPDLPESIKKVGVFVNDSIKVIVDKVIQYNLQAIQLHGDESVEFCKALNEEIKNLKQVQIKIIKVFSISDNFDFELLEPFELVCDYFLFDTKGRLPGGNGFTFDWKVLEKYPSKKPFFLSGGIGKEEINSIKEILKTQLPIHALDLNSKFETKPGLKDKTLFKNFQQNLNL